MRTILRFSTIVFVLVLITLNSNEGFARSNKHIIQFGGGFGRFYEPPSFHVTIGDTIEWIGDLNLYPLVSVTVPPEAESFSASNGFTFDYVVKKVGEYTYQNPTFFSIGLKGNFIADTIHNGVTNEGREFYIGMLAPEYPAPYSKDFPNTIFLMINSYYANNVRVAYYNSAGEEVPGAITYQVLSKGYVEIQLNPLFMQYDTTSERAAYRACHITADQPITVQYVDLSPYEGGSYLALPTIGLGTKYISANYNDNPGVYGIGDAAGGQFMIIATVKGTRVHITPMTTTTGNHTGTVTGKGSTGKPHPYEVILDKAQCYLVRSDGRDDNSDLSGSLIESDQPIAVISGHENATFGGAFLAPNIGADLMIEQLIPANYWDSLGYVSIPLEQPTASEGGIGETYRIYTADTGGIKIHVKIKGAEAKDFNTKIFASPVPELFDIATPIEANATTSGTFSVMQYEERMQSAKDKNFAPAPSMMSVVPISKWKKSYSFVLLTDRDFDLLDRKFINVLSSHFNDIFISINGVKPAPLVNFSRDQLYSGISMIDTSLIGVRYNLTSTLTENSIPYYLYSAYPFMVYYYSLHSSKGSEYASPTGMQLNTGGKPLLGVTIDSSGCDRWHICVHDSSKISRGIKAIILANDPDGAYYDPFAISANVEFDTTVEYMKNEIRPQALKEYCFDVLITNPNKVAKAGLVFVDDNGNEEVLNLFKPIYLISLFTLPTAAKKADSIVFPVRIGEKICTTFVIKNTTKGGTLNFVSAWLKDLKDSAFKIESITHSLPDTLLSGDSAMIQLCYNARDSLRHQDTLIIESNCLTYRVSLDAHGSTGLIAAEDLDFPATRVGDTSCKLVQIKNIGVVSFTLTKEYFLSDTMNFSIDSLYLSKLPLQIKPNGTIAMNICFHPHAAGYVTGSIVWNTNLEAAFKHSVKDRTALTGLATGGSYVKEGEESHPAFTIHPNPVNGNSITIQFSKMDFSTSEPLLIFDILGREVYRRQISTGASQIEIPISTFAEGVYYVKINSIIQKFVKN